MVEPVPTAKPVCALCAGEGFTFQQREDRGIAAACSCTVHCPSCHGQGRLYARDERGYEVLRGCGCGADPRRLSLLTGLRLPTKFLARTLGGYRAYSPAQQRSLLRARRFLDEILSVRYNAGRPTLLATNYPRPGTVGWEFKADGQSAENLEQRVGPRIYSRLHEMCDLMDVLGDDQREVQHDARQARDSAADAPARGTRPARS